VVWALPSTTAPAARRRATDAASAVALVWNAGAAPQVVVAPATWKMSLMPTGIPCSGPRRRPARASSVRSRAVARAPASSTDTHACTDSSRAAMACRHPSRSAVGDSVPSAMRRAASTTESDAGSFASMAKDHAGRGRALSRRRHRRKCGGAAFHSRGHFVTQPRKPRGKTDFVVREQALDSTSEGPLVQDLPPGRCTDQAGSRAGERYGVSVPSPPIRRTGHPILGLPGHTEVGTAPARYGRNR